MRRANRLDHFQPHIAANAVIDVDDQIAGAEGLVFGQEILGAASFLRLADQAVAQNVLFGDDRQPVLAFEPVFQRPDGQKDPALALRHIAKIVDQRRADDLSVFHQPLKSFARAFGIGRDDHRARLGALPEHGLAKAPKRLIGFLLPLGRKIAPDPPASVDDARTRRLRQRHVNCKTR